jgi:hypothetical protein
MEAHLYKLTIHRPAQKYPTENEFIVIGDDPEKRDAEAARIKAWHESNADKPIARIELSPPLRLNDRLLTEHGSRAVDWLTLQARVSEQAKKRPKGIGCIFRGPAGEAPERYDAEELEMLRESIEAFMDEHRGQGAVYLFVGSNWDSQTRLRKQPIRIFEASSIELAADIVQLHFLGPEPATTLTEWCCPIYTA